MIINFPRHKLHSCKEHDCRICEGALSFCSRCGGGEGDLPTDCPGEVMTRYQCKQVYAEELDYRWKQGGWIRPHNWERVRK